MIVENYPYEDNTAPPPIGTPERGSVNGVLPPGIEEVTETVETVDAQGDPEEIVERSDVPVGTGPLDGAPAAPVDPAPAPVDVPAVDASGASSVPVADPTAPLDASTPVDPTADPAVAGEVATDGSESTQPVDAPTDAAVVDPSVTDTTPADVSS